MFDSDPPPPQPPRSFLWSLLVGWSKNYPDTPLPAQRKPFSIQTPKGKQNFPTKGLSFPFFHVIYTDPEDTWQSQRELWPSQPCQHWVGSEEKEKSFTRCETWRLLWASTSTNIKTPWSALKLPRSPCSWIGNRADPVIATLNKHSCSFLRKKDPVDGRTCCFFLTST